MYCENCGHKTGENHLFCEECGSKVNHVVLNGSINTNSSNRTLWIILGSIFGGLFLLVILGIIFFTFITINVKETIDDYDEYEIEEYYDYEDKDSYPYRDDSIDVIRFNKV